MTEPSVDERPPGTVREHPPFRLRERRRLLLPDLTPPTLDELRWATRQRRLRREGQLPAPRRTALVESVEEPMPPAQSVDSAAIAAAEVAVPVDVNVATETETSLEAIVEPPPFVAATRELGTDPAPIVDESAFDIPELDTTELSLPEHAQPELRPWRPVVLPDPEPVTVEETAPLVRIDPDAESEPARAGEPVAEDASNVEASAAAEDEDPPLVSHVLVVREAAPLDPGRIAVLDEVASEVTATVTRLVPLPGEHLDEVVADEADQGLEEPELLRAEVAVPTEVDGRPAPLYWRLLRLRYTRPNGWLRALFFEGSVALAVVLVLAEVASVWTIVVLPFVVAVVVKANDVLAGSLRRSYRSTRR